MYLSKLTLNPASRWVQNDIRAPYEMHRTIMGAFGRNPGRVLFRLERAAGGNGHSAPVLLVQSETLPDWGVLGNGYLLAGSPPLTKPYSPTFAADQSLVFRLRANPTAKSDGHKYALPPERFPEWLERKAHQHGFKVLVQVTTPEGTVPGKGDFVLVSAVFDGILRVTDAEKFLRGIERGIGQSQCFGFGLLSVARPV
jgi:CRISPR system Cascade subunit CasE